MTPTKYHALGLKAKPCKSCGRLCSQTYCYGCSNLLLAKLFVPAKAVRA